MAQLLTAAAQGDENYTGAAARDTANALRIFANAVRAVAATNGDREFQAQIIACCQDVIDKSTALIDEAKRAVANPNDPDNQQRLALVAKAASQALNNCINCLPGLHEIDSSLRLVGSVSQRLAGNQVR
jgi:talin